MACFAQVAREQYTFSLDSDTGEDILAALYLLLKEDGLIPTAFYGRPASLREFLDFAKMPGCRYFVAMAHSVSHVGHCEVAGIGWAWGIIGPPGARRADVGIVFRRKFWGYAERCMRMAVRRLFEDGIDVLYAITADHNRMAKSLIRRVGFTILGPMPGWYTGVERRAAVMGHLTKQAWRGGQ